MSPVETPDRERRLRLTVYDVAGGAGDIVLEANGRWFVYAPSGDLTVEDGAGTRTLEADEGVFVERATRLRGAGAWVYEVVPDGAPFLEKTGIVRSQVLRPPFGAPFLLRADRIESPPGAATPRHGHRGPGMRRLVFGRLLAEVGETIERIEAGQAWFETGREMVVGTNIGDTNAAFVRVMLLPAELAGGKSSFMAENETEAAKPRAVDSRLFGEIALDDMPREESA